MDCRTFALLLEVSPEERDPLQQQEMAAHAQQCPECAALLQVMQDMREMDEEEQLPPEFSMGWRMKIRGEEAMQQKRMKKQYLMKMLATAAAVVLVFGGATLSYVNGWGLPGNKNENQQMMYSRTSASGGNVNGAYTMKTSSMMDTAAEEAAPMLASGDMGAVQAAKIIRTIDYTIKTKTFDTDYEAIQQLALASGGYVESLNVYGDVLSGETRYAHFTLRIPAEKLQEFIGKANTVGAATAYSEHMQDVSADYYDTAARLETQQAKMERLNELLSQATSMTDLIEIESAISDTQYQIDRYTGQLNYFDSKVNYSYVYVSLQELSDADAVELPDVTLGERIVNAVKESVRDMGEFAEAAIVFMLAALPWCAVLAVIVIVIKMVRRAKKK
ncbi:MAG: DUF4349 domain-containing protein [Clostridia bacterium]|nr:DUF4349 domain-containing protein [Clostridia bacterium]